MRQYDSSEAASRMADAVPFQRVNAVAMAQRNLRDALVELKQEAGWTAHHLNDSALLARTVESGEMALKMKGVVEAGEALRAALDAINRPAIAEPWPHPRRD